MLFVLVVGAAFGLLLALPFRRDVPMRIFRWPASAWSALIARVVWVAIGAVVGGAILGATQSAATGADFTLGFGVAAMSCAAFGTAFILSRKTNNR
jgi:hypothetical protein